MMNDKNVAMMYEAKAGFMFNDTYRIIASYIVDYYRQEVVLEVADLISSIEDENLVKNIVEISQLELPELQDSKAIEDYIEIIKEKTVRIKVEEGLVATIREHFPECEVVMGTSTAGIAHAAIVGHLMNIPMGYVRGSAKDHGRTNQIEGKLLPGQKVVVVEDLVSTGGSAVDTVEVLRAAGAEVLGIASIFTYGMKKGLDRFAEHNVKNVSLCDLDALVEVAADTGYIKASDKERILTFRDNPSDEGWMKGDK